MGSDLFKQSLRLSFRKSRYSTVFPSLKSKIDNNLAMRSLKVGLGTHAFKAIRPGNSSGTTDSSIPQGEMKSKNEESISCELAAQVADINIIWEQSTKSKLNSLR